MSRGATSGALPIILVSGGTSGIGRATALLFAERGWRVLACDLNDKACRPWSAAEIGVVRVGGQNASPCGFSINKCS